MKDITSIFLQVAQSIPKNGTVDGEHKEGEIGKPSRQLLKKHAASVSPFLASSRKIFKSIKSLEEALQKVNLSYFRSSVSTSSSTQRSQQAAEQEALEREADVLISQCQQSLKQLQSSIEKSTQNKTKVMVESQLLQHHTAMVDHLSEYLAQVSSVHTKRKMGRLNQALEDRSGYVRKYAPPTRSKSGQRIDASAKKPDLNPPSVNDDGYMTGAVIDESALGIDPQMQETLQKENMILQRRFETMVDQIRVVEGQMASISQANQFIAQNLVKQREDIQQIGDSTLQAETHIVQGNKNLREAAQSGVNFRIFVLLFMLALSFTLLFLHWYE